MGTAVDDYTGAATSVLWFNLLPQQQLNPQVLGRALVQQSRS